MKAHIYSVSQINRYIKGLLEKDVFLNDIFVEAEISNFKAHSSGHFYFTLKDENAAINVIMYKTYSEQLRFMPENGMKVTVYGYISLYEKTGQYQLYARIIEPTGKGALYARFEQLKEQLEKEGLFDQSKKKSIPKYPQTIAVLTSPTGAAIRDIIRISERRNPNVKLIIVPTLVQGDNAPKSICDSLAMINKYKKADVIILGRGGGSIEDLWAFNSEKVARAVFKSKIPVISAVGHETDFTITDFVADLRASTPSAGAEIAVPRVDDILDDLYSLYDELCFAIKDKQQKYSDKVKTFLNSGFLKNPLDIINCVREQLIEYQEDMEREIFDKQKSREVEFNNLVMRLEGVSPMNVIKRGFSITYKDDVPVNSIDSILIDDIIETSIKDGYIKSKVIEKGDLNAKEKNN